MNASFRIRYLLACALVGCALAACGGRSDNAGNGTSAGTGTGTGTGSGTGSGSSTNPGSGVASAAGIWSGSLAPEDPEKPSMTGWLVIGSDGSFNLDTDAALYTGAPTLRDNSVSVSAAAHPYGTDEPGTVTFSANVTDGTMTGTWSGNGAAGAMQFTRQQGISQQQASLATIASDYSGELWIRDARLPVRVNIASDGALHASTDAGCAVEGRVGVADAARNGYSWSGSVTGCSINGEARGFGFVIDGYSLYLGGTVQGNAIWLGGVDARAPVP